MSEVILILSVLIFVLTILHLKRSKKLEIVSKPRTSVSSEYLQRSVADVKIPNTQPNDQKNENVGRMTTPNNKYRCDNLNNYNYQIMNFYTPITEEKISYIINNNKSEIIQPPTEIKQEIKQEEQPKQIDKPADNIPNNNCTYKVLNLSDYLNNETSNFVIDLDEVTHSLSKYHQFNKIDMNHINIPLSELIPKQVNLENVR
jgi:hypothetical protein